MPRRKSHPARLCAALLAAAALAPGTLAQTLDDARIDLVRARLADSAKLSWELGTRAQALLELDAPAFSVFSPSAVPPPTTPSDALTPILAIPRDIVANRARSNNGAQGPQPLMQDGSAADPASNGPAVLLANWTGRAAPDGLDYAGAARDQLDFLYTRVPKTGDGAISHRVSEVQLWSDFVYMVPPFLAYYGVLADNRTLVADAVTQIRLYRNYLRDGAANGLWKHVLLGAAANDEGHWSTGNAWAAAGMLRVLATIKHSRFAGEFTQEQADLAAWVTEIHAAMYPHLESNGLFRNYADRPLGDGNFHDAASAALLAATAYRASLLTGTHTYTTYAERTRRALADPAQNRLTAEGWLTPVVNPHAYGDAGRESAEGQAFVLGMHAAWREWVDAGSRGGAGRLGGGGAGVVAAVAVVLGAAGLV